MKETSVLAHAEIIPHKENLYRQILSGMQKIKQGTFREIAKAAHLECDQVWKRLSELQRKGEIVDTGMKKQCSISNRPCGIWELKE